MKATLSEKRPGIYAIRVGSEPCLVRGYDLETIESLFGGVRNSTDACGDGGASASPWSDIVDADEIVAETMIPPPSVRKRIRRSPSRAVLLGVTSAG